MESLNGVPAAIAAGAMPALTREALMLCAPEVNPGAPHWGLPDAARLRPQAPKAARSHGVRRRTAATAALLAVPAAAGLWLLAPGVLRFLGRDYVEAAPALRVVAFAVIPLYMNAVLLHALIAAGRASWLPRLTAIRVGFAAAAAFAFIPRFGFVAAAAGVLAAEMLLLVLSARACRLADFAVPLVGPLAVAIAATIPMAVAVRVLDGGTIAAALIGAGVYAATMGVAWALMREPLLRVLGAGEAA